jgi:hypothetical protein
MATPGFYIWKRPIEPATLIRMAKEIAAPKVTGGGGFGFEDKVVAYLLACLLTDQPSLDPRFGTIQRLDFQVRVDEWLLDDVLITLGPEPDRRRCAMSVKSNRQFSADAAPAEFVTAAWEIFLNPARIHFDRTKDLLGIATSPLGASLHHQLHELLSWARAQQSDDLWRRVATPGYGNDEKRELLKSFVCPDFLAVYHGRTDEGTGELLKCVQHLAFDFGSEPSNDLARAVALCRTAVRSGELTDARQLWDALCAIAHDYRPVSGFLDLPRLLDLLRSRFALLAYPQYRGDWNSLLQLTQDNIALVPDRIGGKVQLPRNAEIEALRTSPAPFTAVIGPSGCGKSVLARHLAEQSLADDAALWFNARSFDLPDFRAFESALRLAHPLSDLFAGCPVASAMVVIDGLDRVFDERIFANVATLIRKLMSDSEGSPWRIILPTQPEEWSRVYQSLVKANLRVEWSTFNLEEPADLAPVWEAFPKLRSLSYRPELRSLALKPNVLDILATRIDTVDPNRWTGESDLIEWLWHSVIARPPSAAPRAAFVNTLAEMQGDEMRTETSLTRFAIADQQPVDELVADRICTEREGRIAFHHDRYGDWARQRGLISKIDDLGAYLAQRILSPAWHPAIRLLGLHLLEQSPDTERWRAVFVASGSPDGKTPMLLQDLLLESVIFAAAPLPLLERLWPELIRDQGRWLKRLLVRFRHVATLPNPLVMELSQISKVEAATFMRLPYWPYWPPLLKFLHVHRLDLIEWAPKEVALIVDDWLRLGRRQLPLRREAAEIGLAIGRHTLQLLRDKDATYTNDPDFRIAFRAALAGAQELPDDVAAFAFDAAERTREGRERPTHRAVRSKHLGSWEDAFPPPWPDGPFSRVTKAFASECLEISALQPLMVARPAVAREVLLASLIEEPRTPNPYADQASIQRDQLNIDHLHQWFPPLYTRGSFLVFLRLNPSEGLEAILRLVNFAFERWSAVLTERGQFVPSVKLQLGDDERTLLGDYNVYMAYSDSTQWPYPVISALMALEKWLYEQLEAGQSIDPIIETILRRTNSVAFVGLLNAVGCKEPSLYAGFLRALLAVPEFHDWETRRSVLSHRGLPMIGWLREQELARLAQEWHAMEHRKKNMHNEALALMLNNLDARDFLGEQARIWEERRAAEPDPQIAHFLKQLVPLFQIENWSVRPHPEHGRAVVYEAPEELRRENEELLRKSADQQLVIIFPVRCSQLIEKHTPLPAEELETFWNELQRVAGIRDAIPDDDDGISRIENSICGGLAVLFTFHRDWLAAHPDKEEWCAQKISEVLHSPPARARYEDQYDHSDWEWRTFCARIVAILWTEEPDAFSARYFVASLAASPKYKAVEIFFTTASTHRAELGDGFRDLQDFIFDWAVERWKREHTQFNETPHQVGPWLDAQVQAFAERRRPRKANPWDLPAEPAPALATDGNRSPDDPPEYPRLDLTLIQAAYAWLPDLAQAADAQERLDWIAFWKHAQNLSLQVVKREMSGNDESNCTPYDWDQWVLKHTSSLILQLDSPQDRESFWKPVLDLGTAARHWVERFIGDWFMAGLGKETVATGFAREWRRMIDYVRTSGVWARNPERDYHRDELWITLMGLDVHYLWTVDHHDLLFAMQDLYEQWAKEHLDEPDSAAVFAQFLAKPAAEKLLCDGLVWLEKANLRLDRRTRWGDLVEVFASLLAHAWQRNADLIRRHEGAFTAFKKILHRLSELQNPTALALTDQLRT